jgi:hypothetical protein
MAIEASAILPSDSLEEFRVQFNNLISDVDGIAGGNQFVSSIIFEGDTADANETTFLATDPTADRTITIPDATGTMVTTGNAAVGTTTTSIGDVDHVLVNDGGILKKITAANLVAGTASPVAADNVTVGDSAISLATSAGNITIDAQEGDTDIIFKGTDGSSDITALTLDMSDAGKAIFTGAISATTLTLSADGGLLLPNDGNIGSAGSTAAMQIASTGIVTFADDILIKDGGTIGVASATTAMTISSAGIVTFVDDILIKDAGTIGNATTAAAIQIEADGDIVLSDDLYISGGLLDLKNEGSVSQIKLYCESSNAHAQVLQSAPHSLASSSVCVLPTLSGTLIGTGDTGTLPIVAIDIDGGTDVGADLATTDLIIIDDGAGGTNRKAALSRIVTLTEGGATALAIALG